MVNEAVAHRYFPSGDALGQRLKLSRTSPDPWTIVGIVGDVKNYEAATGDELQIYVPFAEQPVRQMTVVLRATGDTAALVGTARDAVASLDAAEPLSHIFTMDALIGQQTAPYVTTATFASFFGAVTLLLAGVGVYGVIAYSFSQRTREIGIRMALGARRADVAALVVGQVRRVLVAGFVPGLVIAWLIGRALQSFLVGVTPTDWGVYLWTSLVLACVAGLAAVVPARRAASVNPVQALHCE
jgi:putative ABC transport system permease protein